MIMRFQFNIIGWQTIRDLYCSGRARPKLFCWLDNGDWEDFPIIKIIEALASLETRERARQTL